MMRSERERKKNREEESLPPHFRRIKWEGGTHLSTNLFSLDFVPFSFSHIPFFLILSFPCLTKKDEKAFLLSVNFRICDMFVRSCLILFSLFCLISERRDKKENDGDSLQDSIVNVSSSVNVDSTHLKSASGWSSGMEMTIYSTLWFSLFSFFDSSPFDVITSWETITNVVRHPKNLTDTRTWLLFILFTLSLTILNDLTPTSFNLYFHFPLHHFEL